MTFSQNKIQLKEFANTYFLVSLYLYFYCLVNILFRRKLNYGRYQIFYIQGFSKTSAVRFCFLKKTEVLQKGYESLLENTIILQFKVKYTCNSIHCARFLLYNILLFFCYFQVQGFSRKRKEKKKQQQNNLAKGFAEEK